MRIGNERQYREDESSCLDVTVLDVVRGIDIGTRIDNDVDDVVPVDLVLIVHRKTRSQTIRGDGEEILDIGISVDLVVDNSAVELPVRKDCNAEYSLGSRVGFLGEVHLVR